MAFPNDPLDVVVELYIDGEWTDITADVLVRDGISITRGRRDEASRTDPARCSLTIINVDGKYSPRNPNSEYYGLIGRNTPIRVSVGEDVRFVGEVASWPTRWDVAGVDVYTSIEASGILRRLGHGFSVSGSVMYRALTRDALNVVAYWPMEDPEGSSSLAPGSPNTGPMKINGSPELASFSQYPCSNPILVLNDAELTGYCPAYSVGTGSQVRMLMRVPSGGAENGQNILTFYTTGTARRWEVFYGTGGTLGLRAFDSNGNQLFTSGSVSFDVNGKLLLLSVELTQSGANIGWNLLTLEVGASSGLTYNGTLNSNTVGRIGTIVVSPAGGIDGIAVGHLSVQSTITSLFELASQLNGWAGETAGRRIERLCEEEGVSFASVGDLDDTAVMGYQNSGTLLELLEEAAETDMGILYEQRDGNGLEYRTRKSMYNQDAAVALDYEAGELAPPLEPVDDDQATKNDITVKRVEGSSYRAVLEVGSLSVNDPPDGVGRYDTSVDVNVRYDEQLPDQASWRLRLGTVDEARYPTITVNMASPGVLANEELAADVITMDMGDRITIDNLPEWIPPGLISQIVWGYSERIDSHAWKITANCSPESPYQVAVWGTSRYCPSSSTLASSVSSSATSLSVATASGPLWTTDDSEFPFDILVGGERMTVTDISGSSSPQTFTVTRSVNGVAKSHSSGAVVELFESSYRAL